MKKALVLTAAFLVVGVAGWRAGVAMGEKEADKPTLPEAAQKAVTDAFPKGTIDKIEEEKAGLKVYEVDLKVEGKEASIVVAPDGTVLKVEAELTVDALPAAVKAAVKVVKLEKSKVEYEVKMTKEGKTWEVEMDADGKVTEKKDVTEEADEAK
ncbi:MAG: PepSY-like domain-containing protein [Planctomycetota bacterium]|nr:PepSY-like domain-containing protein [Planctomycetota bacterium]